VFVLTTQMSFTTNTSMWAAAILRWTTVVHGRLVGWSVCLTDVDRANERSIGSETGTHCGCVEFEWCYALVSPAWE